MEKLHLGVGRSDITPAVGGQLYGYRPDLFSESVEDHLYATAFCFMQGDLRALMISVTVCLINTELSNRIRGLLAEKCGIPAENILCCATHTHSGPNTAGTYGWGDIDAEYCENIFIPAILSAAGMAVDSTVPVTVGVAEGESLVGINRRELNENNGVDLGQNPWGPMDRRMTVISFRDAQEKCVANIVHYGCHGTAAGANCEISRDWSGLMCDALERQSGAITAFFNGPEGDVGPRITNGSTTGRKTVEGKVLGDIRYVKELGMIAGRDAVRIWREIWDWRNVELRADSRKLYIPLKAKLDAAEAREKLKKYEGRTVNLGGQIRRHLEQVLQAYAAGVPDAESYPVEQSVLGLGNLIFAGIPYETFSEIGLRLERMVRGGRVLSLSNTNGSEGYYITEDAICRGGYEVNMFLYGRLQPFCDHADFALLSRSAAHIREVMEK